MKAQLWLTIIAVTALAVFVIVPLAHAGWKHCKGTGKFIESGPEMAFDCDDWPKHRVSIEKSVTEQTCDCPELDGSRQTSYEYHDRKGTGGTSFAYYTLETRGGDKIFGKYSGRGRREIKKDGSWEGHFIGEWEEYDGTGKLQGVKGKGAYWGKITPAGVSIEWEGDYFFPDK
ncbi:MAG: hypothetical protein V1878_11280 [bacterium]